MGDRRLKIFEDVFFRTHSKLVVYALRFTGDKQAAKDIVQDAFLKYWEKIDEINTSPDAYLFRTVKNMSLNYNRHVKIAYDVKAKLKNKISNLEKNIYKNTKNPYHSLLERELDEKIEKVIDSLPPKSKMIFDLRRNKFLKNKEIAEQLGITVKAVEKHITNVFKIFRKELSDYF